MSEITVDFTFRFEDDSTAEPLHHGLSLINDGHFAEARDYLIAHDIDMPIKDPTDTWWLEHYHRDGRYLNGYLMGGTVTFDEDRFFRAVEASSTSHILADVVNTQVG